MTTGIVTKLQSQFSLREQRQEDHDLSLFLTTQQARGQTRLHETFLKAKHKGKSLQDPKVSAAYVVAQVEPLCTGRAWRLLKRQDISYLPYQLHTTVMSATDLEVGRPSLAPLIFLETQDSGYVLNLTL